MTLLRRSIAPALVVFGLTMLSAQTDPEQARQSQPPAGQPAARGTATPPASATGAPVQGRGNRGGNPPFWWREESPYSKELSLTKDQIAKIEKLWQETRPELSKLLDDLARRENMLSDLIKDDAGEAQVRMMVERVERTRLNFNQTRTMMLYHMRQVLTAPQRATFQDVHAKWQQEQNKADLERQQRQQMNQSGKPPAPNGKTDGKPAPDQRGRPGQ